MTWQTWTWVQLGLLIAAWTAACVFGWLWWRERYGYTCTHTRLIPVATSRPGHHPFSLAAPNSTAILWRCSACCHVEAGTVPGSWSLDDVLAWGTGFMPEGWGDYDDGQDGLDVTYDEAAQFTREDAVMLAAHHSAPKDAQ